MQRLKSSYSHSDSKESACNAGDPSSIPGTGRSLEKGQATHSSVLGLPGGSDGKESWPTTRET